MALAEFAENSYGIRKRLSVIEEWLELLRSRTGKSNLRILDYGCGTGAHLTAPLARRGYIVTGFDIHEPSVQEARKKHDLPNLGFLSSRETLLSLSFDVIICSEVIEHVSDPVALLSALRPLLYSGGAVVVTTPNGYGSYEILSSLQKCVHQLGAFRFVNAAMRKVLAKHQDDEVKGFLNEESGHIHFFRVKGLERIFQKSGFRVETRRSRTLLCGPYVDLVFKMAPFRAKLIALNAELADRVPFKWTADWMFLLRPVDSDGRS